MMVQDPFYIDFSKQLDNEIWYITFDNNPIKNIYNYQENSFFIGRWGKQPDLQFVKHIYENGLSKIIYNKPIIKLGENSLKTNNVKIISFPKQFKYIYAYCLNYGTQSKLPIIGIFNVINNTVNISLNSVIFYQTYVKTNVTFNGSYIPPVIIVR